jgi:hypothetical protein
MLRAAARFSLLAFGILGFRSRRASFRHATKQLEPFISNIRQSDVKNHLSPRFRTKIHLCEPASQPDATGFSAAEPDAIKASPSTFADDFLAEHSSSAGGVTTAHPVRVARPAQAPPTSKRAEA